MKNKVMNFEEWLYKVCEIISLKTRQEITDVYSSISLRNARLSFLDGEAPEEYNDSLSY